MKLYISREIFIYIIICFILSLIIVFIPWDSLNPKGFFIDREGYISSYEYKRFRLDNFSAEYYYDYIKDEWLWRYINGYARNNLNISPTYFFGLITFSTFFTYSLFILSKTKNIYVLIYLINPLFISFIYSQLRLSFAMSLFIVAIYLFRKKYIFLSILFFIFSSFIHTSILLFLLFLLFSVILSKLELKDFYKILLIFISGLIVNLLIGPWRYTILSSFGDRRADYDDFSSPAIYFLIYGLYFLIVIYLILKGKLKILSDYAYIYAFSIFSLIIFSLFLGGYVSRFVVATQFFIIVSLFFLKGRVGVLFHSVYILYLCILWIGFLI